jgi:hypothetical protein
VVPYHAAPPDFFAEVRNPQKFEFPILHKRENRCGAPLLDCIEIEGEVAIPASGLGVWIVLPWAERDVTPIRPRPDPAPTAAI